MPQVVVLRAGYSGGDGPLDSRAGCSRAGGELNRGGGELRSGGDGERSSRAGCSITLVLGGACGPLLVDCGGPSEREVVLRALAAQRLGPGDVTCVVCTHGHIDHVGNANLFPGATFVSGQDRAVGDRFWSLDFAGGSVGLAEGIRVAATPGHTSEDISVLVETATGVVAIAGDVFENGDALDLGWRAYSRDARVQARSQAELLAIASWIVPGHGAMFRVASYLAGA